MALPNASVAVSPLIYGDMNYALTDFRAVRIAFADLPSVDPPGSALRGTGLAVSAFGEAPAEAPRFAHWVASGTVPRGPVARAGGPPPHAHARVADPAIAGALGR